MGSLVVSADLGWNGYWVCVVTAIGLLAGWVALSRWPLAHHALSRLGFRSPKFCTAVQPTPMTTSR